ncbi:serum paraoxonase arylesterase 2 [Lasius niger]|uniref:Serum paraoxonase arylesterase 2 n=1 Tax=Lasius niger TaxID=67767 RepID=A0A0J7K2D4_LASNI|nr:serum paraoxonase arylesterase 2 [Lasius niger]
MSHVVKMFRGDRVRLGGGMSSRASFQDSRLHCTCRSVLFLGCVGDPAVLSCRSGPGDVGGGSDCGREVRCSLDGCKAVWRELAASLLTAKKSTIRNPWCYAL